MRTVCDADRRPAPRRRAQHAAADRADLADQIASLETHLQQNLPAFLRSALQKERRRLLTEARAQEGGQP